ncbi:MAG: hypothetical protein ACP5D2_04610 [Candidatus Nanoarchaeia archaeon]
MSEETARNRLIKNVSKLNSLLAGDVAYLDFGLQETGYKQGCFGCKFIPGEMRFGHAYTSNGQAVVSDKAVVEGRTLIPAPVDLRRCKVYGQNEDFNPDYFALALTGEHLTENGWHLFYHNSQHGHLVFDWGMSRERPDWVDVEASVYVLPSNNIRELLRIEQDILKEKATLPDYIDKEKWYGTARDPERVIEQVRNPDKNVDIMDVFERAGWPPKFGETRFLSLPRLPDKGELEQAIREIEKQAQGQLF